MSMFESKDGRMKCFTFRLSFTFFLTCILVSGCASGNKNRGPEADAYKLEIQRVIDANNELLRERNEALKQSGSALIEASRAYANYGQGLRSIDMTRCPVDFQVAFLEYIHTIEDVSSKMQKEPEGLGWGKLLGLIDFNVLALIRVLSEIGRTEREKAAIRKEIEITLGQSQERWRKVELIAVRYGVRLQAPSFSYI